MAAADRSGIVRRYKDALGKWRETPEESYAAILEAIGGQEREAEASLIVVRSGQRKRLRGPSEIALEDGALLQTGAALPRELPLGYHTLRYLDFGQEVKLIVSPGCCYLPPELRVWGWSAQLYAARSGESWGIGDFADLRRLARWSAEELGAGVLLVNPLQTALPLLPQQPSPYFPSSRRFRNPLYLRIEEIPGAAEAVKDLDRVAAAGKALNFERRIDRDAVFKLKMDALQILWSRFPGDPRFDEFRRAQGEPLAEFAVFSTLAEEHHSGWRNWPDEYRHPGSPAVARFAAHHADRVRFHQWVQWLLDEQLARAAEKIPLMQDLPIGVDPDGADAWAWQDVFASGVKVGCPPDQYNTRGQNWGLPPLIPWKLRAAGYEPFIQTIRATLRHAGGLRIDHVMGLFRLFWIPDNADPRAGAYVRYAEEEMLAILALESERAKAYIVGEDLGTVEEKARKQLIDCCILSYRLLWFESDPPARFPRQALAAVTTHDLPTIAGLWTGSDLQAQRELGLNPNEEGLKQIRERVAALMRISEETPVEEIISRTYRAMADVPSMIVTATLDDALAVEERPNMPGTTDERWPNWSVALPQSLEDLERSHLAREIARSLAREAAGASSDGNRDPEDAVK